MNPPGELIDDLRLLEPPNPWLLYYWIGGALLAILLVVLLVAGIRAWRRRARAHGNDVRAAQETALAALESLFSLIEEGHGRPYAIESSAIIRQYIEQRFDIRAPVRSTEEFLHEAQRSSLLAPEYQELLGQFLRCCDLLKFGRGIAERSELEELHHAATRFVTETRIGKRKRSK